MSKYKFEDIVAKNEGLLKGPFGSDLKKELYVPKGKNTYKVYLQENILTESNDAGNYYISKDYYESKMSRYAVKNNDFIVTCDGTLGEIFQLKNLKEPGIISSSLLRITLNEELVDPTYFKYYFRFYIKNSLIKKSNNSVLVHLPGIKVIKNIEIEIPSLDIQKKIGHPLQIIDNQIRQNNKMVQKLQVLAQSIFIKLFSNQNNYISLIKFPYINFIKPGINKFEEKKHYLATSEVDDNNFNYNAPMIEYDTRENRANMQPVSNSIWFAKMKNSIKHIYITKSDDYLIDNYILSTGFCGMKCEDIAFEYMINYINSPYFEMKKDILSHGATMESINNTDLKSFKILLPAEENLLTFHQQTEKIYISISKIKLMSYRLEILKKRLLPLLINGQLK